MGAIIKKISYAGIEPVYNMTVSEHHNFLISGGLVLKNCDALRYFAVSRVLATEIAQAQRDDDFEDDALEDYDEMMTGGAVDDGYLNY